MRISKILLVTGAMVVSPYLAAEKANPVPGSCAKLIAALEACDKGPEGPFGAVRKTCKQSAKAKYKCDLPVNEVRRLLKK